MCYSCKYLISLNVLKYFKEGKNGRRGGTKKRGDRKGGKGRERETTGYKCREFLMQDSARSLVTRTSEGAVDSEMVPCSVAASPCLEVGAD